MDIMQEAKRTVLIDEKATIPLTWVWVIITALFTFGGYYVSDRVNEARIQSAVQTKTQELEGRQNRQKDWVTDINTNTSDKFDKVDGRLSKVETDIGKIDGKLDTVIRFIMKKNEP